MALLTGKSSVVAAVLGILTTVVLSRNKFLVTNVMEMAHRFKHSITGDRYEALKTKAESEPWFGKKDGVVIVTGSNSGLGFETAQGLARAGCRVVLAVRNKERGEEAANKIRRSTGNDKIDVMLLDMTSIASVRAFATAFTERNLPLHVLIHNAGASGKNVSINKDGFEDTMALNYLNIVLLTSLLMPVINKTSPSRIIMVGSAAHIVGVKGVSLCFGDDKDKTISGWDLYASSKLSVTAYANQLARRLSVSENSKHVSVYSLDPGFVHSSFYDKPVPFPVSVFGMVAGMAAKSSETGAHSSLFAALSPVPPSSGAYFCDTIECTPSDTAQDTIFQDKLMEATVKKLKQAAPWWNEAWY